MNIAVLHRLALIETGPLPPSAGRDERAIAQPHGYPQRHVDGATEVSLAPDRNTWRR
ncbi:MULTISPECIES: hypothetical protein [Streptomyces]|uniref:hypothetical protein n=1 Tax=Streptomyces TaxID=1883 RepID=UPI003445F0DC